MDSSNGSSMPNFGAQSPNVSGGGGGSTPVNPQIEWSPQPADDGTGTRGTDLHRAQAATALSSMSITFDGLHSSQAQTALEAMEIAYPDLHESQAAFAISEFERRYNYGANASLQQQVNGRSDWSNVSNAEQETDGSNATISGSATGARGGRIILVYKDIPDFTTYGFTVVSAHLDFYTSQSGTLLNNGDLRHQYDVGGSEITLDTFTADVTNNPATYDITSNITNQSQVNDLTTYIRFESSLGQTYSATADAVHFRLVATHA